MNNLSQKMVRAARSRGYSLSNPVLLTTDANGIRVNVVVSAYEPHAIRAPLNLIWINPEEDVVRKRVSRESSDDLTQSWTTTFEYFEPQIWDEPQPADQVFQELNRNVGNTHFLEASDIGAIGEEGGVLTGPLSTEKDTGFETDEFVPLSFIQRLVAPIQNLTSSIYFQLTSIRNQLHNVSRRVVALELITESIEGIRGVSHSFTTGDEDFSTIIKHDLDAEVLAITVVRSDGVPVIYDYVETISRNESKVVFAGPVTGIAVIIRVQ